MTLNRTLLTASLIGCALVGGCQKPARPIAAQQDAVATNGYPPVTLEAGLRKALVVDYGRIVYDLATETTPTSVQVPVRSEARIEIFVQYQYNWYDDAGRFVRASGWKRERMPSGQERMFTANAIDARSTNWRLEIRSAR